MVSISERYEPWTLTPYEKWVSDEGLAVHTQQLVPDINTIEVANWERTGTKAALLDLTGEPLDGALVNNQGTIRFVCDIPPGGSFKLERHMYEEIFLLSKVVAQLLYGMKARLSILLNGKLAVFFRSH